MRTKMAAAIVTSIAHVAIKVDDLELTCKFYEVVLGLTKGRRPSFGYPGAWLFCHGGSPIIHLYGGDRGVDSSGNPYLGTLAVDHLSINCNGYGKVIGILGQVGLYWREFDVPDTSLRQVFVYDPNGVLLELTFDKAQEPDISLSQILDQKMYIANVPFFNLEATRDALSVFSSELYG